MRADRQVLDALVANYLARGGRVRTIPEDMPLTPLDLMRYLETWGVVVEPRLRNAKGKIKYRHKGQLLDWPDLVRLANKYRRRQRLPPFQVT